MEKNGFNLAEVFITLGVIGVVAAITMPILIKNYQKAVWTNQLKKSYVILQQGFTKMLADDEVNLLSQTTVFHTLGNNQCSDLDINNPNNSNICKNFSLQLRKYFKIINSETSWRYPFPALYETYKLNGNKDSNVKTITTFIDKTTWIHVGAAHYGATKFSGSPDVAGSIYPFTTRGTNVIAEITIDLNGSKKPNTFGRDIFGFWVMDNGVIRPLSTNISNWWRDYHKCNITGSGATCAGRVLEEGKMNY